MGSISLRSNGHRRLHSGPHDGLLGENHLGGDGSLKGERETFRPGLLETEYVIKFNSRLSRRRRVF